MSSIVAQRQGACTIAETPHNRKEINKEEVTSGTGPFAGWKGADMVDPQTKDAPQQTDEITEEQRAKFEVISRRDKLGRSYGLMVAGLILFLLNVVLEGIPFAQVPVALIELAVFAVIAVPAGLLTLIAVAKLFGTNFGTLTGMTVKLAGLNLFLLPLGQLFLMMAESVAEEAFDPFAMTIIGLLLSSLAFLTWTIIGAGLFMDLFERLLASSLIDFLLVFAVEAAVLSALNWSLIRLGWW